MDRLTKKHLLVDLLMAIWWTPRNTLVNSNWFGFAYDELCGENSHALMCDNIFNGRIFL